jgi:quinol monooxygenase YgiN
MTMYVRVTTIEVQPGKLDELVAIFRDVIAPRVKELPGCLEFLFLTDPSSGKAMSVSVWQSEAAWAPSEKSGIFQEQAAKLTGIVAGAPIREGYTLNFRM